MTMQTISVDGAQERMAKGNHTLITSSRKGENIVHCTCEPELTLLFGSVHWDTTAGSNDTLAKESRHSLGTDFRMVIFDYLDGTRCWQSPVSTTSRNLSARPQR